MHQHVVIASSDEIKSLEGGVDKSMLHILHHEIFLLKKIIKVQDSYEIVKMCLSPAAAVRTPLR